VFEELDGPLVFLGRAARLERAKVSPAAAFGVDFARVETIFSGLQFADHDILISSGHISAIERSVVLAATHSSFEPILNSTFAVNP
jgi:hypothetical protein